MTYDFIIVISGSFVIDENRIKKEVLRITKNNLWTYENHRKDIIILGAESFAKEVADLISDCREFQLAWFIDQFVPANDSLKKFDRPVYTLDEASIISKTHLFVCGTGRKKREEFIKRAVNKHFRYFTLIQTSANVSKTALIGEGTVVKAVWLIAANPKFSSHGIINRGSLIGHYVENGDFTSIGPGANIAGKTALGESLLIDTSAVTVDNGTIG